MGSQVEHVTTYSGEEGSVQVIGEVPCVVFKETRRHETPPATAISCALTQRPALSHMVVQRYDRCHLEWIPLRG